MLIENVTMTNDKDLYLGADTEDIEDALKIIEESYNIEFVGGELKHIKTFGELCDHIISKIQLTGAANCTTQQAFYKLRHAITNAVKFEKEQIRPDTRLSIIFPKQKRKAQFSKAEKKIGFKLNALQPKHMVNNLILIFLLISFIGMFFHVVYGLIGFASSAILFRIAEWTGAEFKVDTVGQLADKMSQDNYIKSRRNHATVNRKEIAANIEKLFIEGLSLDLKEIKRGTLIVSPD
jgi:acyl carrier protein/uncharacterized membrane protein